MVVWCLMLHSFSYSFIHACILLSLVQEAHSLFQSVFSTECFPFQFPVHYMELKCPELYVLSFMSHIPPTYNQVSKNCGNEKLYEFMYNLLILLSTRYICSSTRLLKPPTTCWL